ncbi:MAG: hypothetical protein HQL54_10045 [Magnetococcales bacterium]|nr:hypothetical protein [Magnetococcales bacterium]
MIPNYTEEMFAYLPEHKRAAAAAVYNEQTSCASHFMSNGSNGHGWDIPTEPDSKIVQHVADLLSRSGSDDQQ